MSTQPKLTLCRGWLDRGCYVWSPFVTKVEFHLRMSNIAYGIEAGSTSKAPKGKIPYLKIQNDQASYEVADSTLIIKHLTELGILADSNASLSASMRLQDLGVRALLEEKLYFYHMQERWIENFYAQRNKVLSSTPRLIRPLIGLLIFKTVNKTLHGQGTGRLSQEEIRAFKGEIWECLDQALVSSREESEPSMPFWILGGAEATAADASLFAFITSVLVCDSCPHSRKLVQNLSAVMDYAERIHDRYFPDYVKWDY